MIAVARHGASISLTREAAERTERGRGGGTSTPAPSEQIVSVKRDLGERLRPARR